MKERKLTVNLAWANIFGLIVFVIVAIPTAYLWQILWGFDDVLSPSGNNMSDEELSSWLTSYIIGLAIVIIVCLAGTVIHELIHGITWAHYAKGGWKSISFGVLWKKLTPYCHCDEPLLVRPYIIGALMPLIVLGILPWVLGLCIGSFWTTVFGVFFIVAAAGDILIVWKLRQEKATSSVLDHPTEAGCIIYDE